MNHRGLKKLNCSTNALFRETTQMHNCLLLFMVVFFFFFLHFFLHYTLVLSTKIWSCYSLEYPLKWSIGLCFPIIRWALQIDYAQGETYILHIINDASSRELLYEYKVVCLVASRFYSTFVFVNTYPEKPLLFKKNRIYREYVLYWLAGSSAS